MDANVVAAPAGMPAPMYNNDNGIGNNPTDATFSAATSTKMYDLKATSTASSKTGLGITLKVMAGDRIDIFGKSYWKLPAGSTTISSPELALAALDLLNALTGTTGVIATGKGLSGATLNTYNNIPMTTGSNGFLNNQPAQTTTLPKAYINYIFFDENFKYVSGGFSRVGAGGVVKDHIAELQNKVATKSGYLYIYCSNESQIDVFFDNLQVKHTRSPILEETHYYPFGLTMSGISSKAAGKLENKYKYNGIELNTDFDLNIGETFFRSHDPQLGRWWQIDPKPNEMLSPYAAMNNNPLLLSDPLGDTTWLYNQNGAYLGVVNDKLKNQTHYLSTEGDPGTPINVSGKNAKTLGQSFRKSSIAFIGSKTVSDMRSIVNKSVAAKVEIGFVGVIGKDKEIRLNALPVDESNKINSVDVGSQISKNYPSSSDQKSLFLEGHTHIADYVNGVKFGDGSPMAGQRGTGTPTKPEDYTPVLDRGNGVAGPAPSLLATPFGVTLYGTGHMTPIGQPSPNNSYLIYKSLK